MSGSPNEKITQILEAARRANRSPSSELLPIVYDELRKLAHARMAHLAPGNTLQPTALVHEAYVRLVGSTDPGWDNRGHFFAAASRAMRRILIDQARRKAAVKHGGDLRRVDIEALEIAIDAPGDDVIALDEALQILEKEDERKAKVVMLRYFAGLNREETAEALNCSIKTVERDWRYAIARLHQELSKADNSEA